MRRPPRRRSEDPSEPAVVPATLHLPACTGPHVPQAAAVTGAVGTGRGRPWSPKICHTVGLIGDLARQTHARADTVVPTLECATSMPDFCTPSRTPPAAPRAGFGPLSPTFSPTRIPEEPNNRHHGHKKRGSSEPVMKERMRAGRWHTFLVIRQSVAISSSRFSGWPLASVALKCAQTSSSGLSSGA